MISRQHFPSCEATHEIAATGSSENVPASLNVQISDTRISRSGAITKRTQEVLRFQRSRWSAFG
jgi:hypothetical protein